MWMTSKGFERESAGSWRNTVDITMVLNSYTSSLLARFRTGFQSLDENGADVSIKRVRPYFSINVDADPVEAEVRVSSLLSPSGTPTHPILKTLATDRGWYTFPGCPNAPLHQFDVRLKNPIGVGEMKGIEVEYEYAGPRR
jgi:hypothetical protein